MAFDARSTPATAGAVVPFPLPAPRYDAAKRGLLKRGHPIPENVVLLRPIEPVKALPMTPERTLLRAIGRALPPKVRRQVQGSLWSAYMGGDLSSGVALEIWAEASR